MADPGVAAGPDEADVDGAGSHEGPGAPDGPVAPDEPATDPDAVGPPLSVLALGAASALLALLLVVVDTTATHVLGYLCGSLIPIVCIGLYRRFDLARRKSPHYVPGPVPSWVVPAVAAVGLVAAAIHIWALATQLAS